MGVNLYIVLNPSVDGAPIDYDRVFAAQLMGDEQAMDVLCAKLGVRSLNEFQSYDSQMAAEFIDDPKVLNDLAAKSAIQWFDPSDALQTLQSLQRHYVHARFIKERGIGRKKDGKFIWEAADRTEGLLHELKNLESVLTCASSCGAKFRLFLGF